MCLSLRTSFVTFFSHFWAKGPVFGILWAWNIFFFFKYLKAQDLIFSM